MRWLATAIACTLIVWLVEIWLISNLYFDNQACRGGL
jgi:hypothetical protein